MLDGLHKIISSFFRWSLTEELRKVQIVPADDRVLDESAAACGDFLFFFLTLNELLIVAEGDCL